MIAGLKPYPAMKESGVPWLGAVPEQWQMRRLKYLLEERDARSASGSEQLLRVSQYTGVTRRTRGAGDDTPDTRAESLLGYKVVAADDLVVNIMLAWNGSMGVSRCSGIVSPAYCVYRFKQVAEPWFFHHLLRSPALKALIRTMSTGVVDSRLRLYTDGLFGLRVPLPPLPEQAAIVRFLDYVDRRIRRYIRAKQKLIKLLEEQKQAIIHRAVTRGLDPNVRLKPSGVEWLGEVPEHWEVTTTRRVLAVVTSGSRGWSKFFSDCGALFLQSGNIGRSMELDWRRVQRVAPPSGAEGSRTEVRRNDIVICITGALTGNVAHVHEDLPSTYVNQHVAMLRAKEGAVAARFLAYMLHSRIGQDQLRTAQYGGTKQGLGLDDVRNVVFAHPGLAEQGLLVAALDAETAGIRQALRRQTDKIDLVREYRTRLIADVVTGKLDVREVAAHLPIESEESEAVDEPEADSSTEPIDSADPDEVPEAAEA